MRFGVVDGPPHEHACMLRIGDVDDSEASAIQRLRGIQEWAAALLIERDVRDAKESA